MIRLSQGHLKILEICPRQFQHIYLDRLTPPISPNQQQKSQLGHDFHLLMQQREMGLSIEPILERSPELASLVNGIVNTAPELFQTDPQAWRESEHVRTMEIDNYLFTARYDLVILTPDRADIIDWKTYPLPRYKKDLDRDWQTRLYLYILAETSEYVPKQMNFIYWFIKSTPQPKSVKISYTLKQHRQTQTDLRALLSKLTNWLDSDRNQSAPFPQITTSIGACQYCSFARRCGREQPLDSNASIALAEITSIESSFDRIPVIPI